MLTRHQHVQQHTERVDVARRGDRLAAQLLGRRVARCECARRLGFAPIRLQRRDTEVEQLHDACGRHQHVGGLQIAVHDEIGVRMRHRIEYRREQAQPRCERQRARGAVAVDGLALDVLEYQVRLPAAGHACIEQPRDVGMSEPREQARLAADVPGGVGAETAALENLERRLALELAVVAAPEPYAPHAAATEEAHDLIGADLPSDEIRVRIERRALHEPRGAVGVIERQQLAESCAEGRIARRERRQPLPAPSGPELERFVEELEHPGPLPCAIGRRH